MLLVQDPDAGQELLQACANEQWDVAEALIDSGSELEAQDKVMVCDMSLISFLI